MAPRQPPPEDIVEADRFEETPHPRETFAFFGHEAAEKALLELYRSGRMPHACLIGGPPGIGKATLAWRLARFILATPSPDENEVASTLHVAPDHPVARQVAALAHPDLFLLRRAWNANDKKLFSEIRVDDVRKATRMFHHSAGRGGYRICILDSTEDLNAEGANALLKIIEEPPPRSVFLLVAHRPDCVLATIRSRCRRLSLKPLSTAEISQVVESLGSPWSDAPEEERRAVSAAARGSVHDALRRLGTRGGGLAMALEAMMAELPRIDWSRVHGLAEQLARPDHAADIDTMLLVAFDWLDRQAKQRAEAEPQTSIAGIAGYARAWEALAAMARQVKTYNLDRRPFVLSLFRELADTTR